MLMFFIYGTLLKQEHLSVLFINQITMITDHLSCRYSSSSLPEELIEHIIARVPCIKSILRCTSVCKSWHALINSTHFINFHLSLIPNNNNLPKLLLCEYDEAELPYFTVHDGIEAFHDSCYFYRIRHNIDQVVPDLVNDSDEGAPYFAIHNDSEEFQEYYRIKSCPPAYFTTITCLQWTNLL